MRLSAPRKAKHTIGYNLALDIEGAATDGVDYVAVIGPEPGIFGRPRIEQAFTEKFDSGSLDILGKLIGQDFDQ
jgi:hypothetical protein